MTRMRGMTRVMLAAVVVVAAGCGSDDDADTTIASTTATSAPDTVATTAATTAETMATTTMPPATTAPTAAPATTAPATTAVPVTSVAPATTASTEPPATTTAPSAGSGTAVVEVAGARYEFRVTQCLRDVPNALGEGVLDLSLDGVPPDTPDGLIEPLLGVIDPDADVIALIEPVLEYGPALSVSRVEGGGDFIALYDLDTIEFISDPDALSPSARFLDVPDGDSGITITGSTTASGQPLQITATCP